MSALFIVVATLILFSVGYIFYGGYLKKLFNIDPLRPTPAITKKDGVDLVASRHWTVLFGHHFASIAGAGPILGPVIAISLWGWIPSLLWVVLGTILLGGIHDFGSLIVSVRNDGRSIADISGILISKRTKVFFSIFVFLALILVIAVFTVLSAKTFVVQPEIIIPSLGLIPLAIFTGVLLYRFKLNQVVVTFLGLGLLIFLLILGNIFPIKVSFFNGIYFWIIILFLYCYFASVLPVNLLLQPRDYLSSFLLFFGLIFGYLGIFISSPRINFPAFISYNTNSGPLWPILFVTIACGAISGFHSLIASGTTSKQLSNERDALKIGYGAMIAEGLLAMMAVIMVITTFYSQKELNEVFKNYGGPIGAFGKGFGKLTYYFLGGYSEYFAILILNAFVLTTLDTATRISRFLFSEITNLKNRYFSTLIVVVLGAALAFTGKWEEIWPIFGASNQLVAGLSLIVIAAWVILQKKRSFLVFIPTIFMLFTTIGALIFQIRNFLKDKNLILTIISFLLIFVALFTIWEARKIFLKNFKVRKI